MIENFVRKGLEDFTPYKYKKVEYSIKLDANESPFNMSEKVKIRLKEYIENELAVNVYPDSNSVELKKKLGQMYGIDYEGIVVGVGSDQMIDIIYNAFLNPGEKIIVPYPSFTVYEITGKLFKGVPVRVKLLNDGIYEYNVDQFISAIKNEKAKVAVICNPNSPTGNILSEDQIRNILNECSETIIIVDEAYGEFANQTVIPLVKEFENLIVLRTFSKAYGIAGARVGYSLSCPETADILNKIKAPFNLSTLSQVLARFVLEDAETNKDRINEIIRQRESLIKEIKDIDGITVFPSKSNFILIKVRDSEKVYNSLLEKGILVIDFLNKENLENCLRISVGLEWQNKILVDVLKQILSSEGNSTPSEL